MIGGGYGVLWVSCPPRCSCSKLSLEALPPRWWLVVAMVVSGDAVNCRSKLSHHQMFYFYCVFSLKDVVMINVVNMRNIVALEGPSCIERKTFET